MPKQLGDDSYFYEIVISGFVRNFPLQGIFQLHEMEFNGGNSTENSCNWGEHYELFILYNNLQTQLKKMFTPILVNGESV